MNWFSTLTHNIHILRSLSGALRGPRVWSVGTVNCCWWGSTTNAALSLCKICKDGRGRGSGTGAAAFWMACMVEAAPFPPQEPKIVSHDLSLKSMDITENYHGSWWHWKNEDKPWGSCIGIPWKGSQKFITEILMDLWISIIWARMAQSKKDFQDSTWRQKAHQNDASNHPLAGKQFKPVCSRYLEPKLTKEISMNNFNRPQGGITTGLWQITPPATHLISHEDMMSPPSLLVVSVF